MPRNSRKRMVGKLEDRDRREREKALRALRRELRRAWRERTWRRAQADELNVPETTPDA